ncbi:hypothetical protein E2C01_096764 [Portunus trituberculatus]|uniref:Uncharacterized protein n=1 Tax=Portunus trituberculatus TaxID=210409 RepID=A0A5B7K9C3_PORTR|nr:hypothetical protein [Portunus trituberculatus]
MDVISDSNQKVNSMLPCSVPSCSPLPPPCLSPLFASPPVHPPLHHYPASLLPSGGLDFSPSWIFSFMLPFPVLATIASAVLNYPSKAPSKR